MLTHAEKQTLRTNERRKFIFAFLGDKCAQCGSTRKLQIDQIVRRKGDSKYLPVRPWHVIIEEVKRCQLLCEKCHVAKTFEEKGLERRAC